MNKFGYYIYTCMRYHLAIGINEHKITDASCNFNGVHFFKTNMSAHLQTPSWPMRIHLAVV